jgi:hypothetical protein
MGGLHANHRREDPTLFGLRSRCTSDARTEAEFQQYTQETVWKDCIDWIQRVLRVKLFDRIKGIIGVVSVDRGSPDRHDRIC